MKALFEMGILQRDISLGNLLISSDPETEIAIGKVIDLGLAVDLEDREKAGVAAELHHHLTVSYPACTCTALLIGGRLQGTLPYMATDLLRTLGLPDRPMHSICHDIESLFWVLFYVCIKAEVADPVSGFPRHPDFVVDPVLQTYLKWMENPSAVDVGSHKATILEDAVNRPFVFRLRFNGAQRFLRQYALLCRGKSGRTFEVVEKLFKMWNDRELDGDDPATAEPDLGSKRRPADESPRDDNPFLVSGSAGSVGSSSSKRSRV